jgi:hypothetical protein
MSDRMSEDDGHKFHPAAIETAKSLEHAGYVQAHHKELEDGEDVIAVDGRNGNVAPVRHHTYGEVNDESRIVEHHIVESYPGSPHAQRMPLKHAYAESAQGGPFCRMGFFRMTSPDHAHHAAHLYSARDSAHRSG